MTLLRNQKAQAILEMLLVLVMVLGIWTAVSKTLASRGTFDTVFGKPWVRLKNTVEYGIPSDAANLMQQHPAQPERHSVRDAK